MKQFNGVYPISGEDLSALPVKAVDPAVEFYRTVLGFTVVEQDAVRATVQRDDARLGLVAKPDHNPGEAGSCAFGMTDLDAMHRELSGRGLDLGASTLIHDPVDAVRSGGSRNRRGKSPFAPRTVPTAFGPLWLAPFAE